MASVIRVCRASGTTESRQKPQGKSDLLIVLRVQESWMHGEAAGGIDSKQGHIRLTQRRAKDENKIARNS